METDRLTEVNCLRSEELFPVCQGWRMGQWGNAIAGEVGELCNMIKKRERDGEVAISGKDIGKELADIVIYADLIASKIGLNLGECIVHKFNEVSHDRGSMHFLQEKRDEER